MWPKSWACDDAMSGPKALQHPICMPTNTSTGRATRKITVSQCWQVQPQRKHDSSTQRREHTTKQTPNRQSARPHCFHLHQLLLNLPDIVLDGRGDGHKVLVLLLAAVCCQCVTSVRSNTKTSEPCEKDMHGGGDNMSVCLC